MRMKKIKIVKRKMRRYLKKVVHKVKKIVKKVSKAKIANKKVNKTRIATKKRRVRKEVLTFLQVKNKNQKNLSKISKRNKFLTILKPFLRYLLRKRWSRNRRSSNHKKVCR